MARIAAYLLLFLVVVHGLIHLMGFVAYWPLAPIHQLPYHTTLLRGRWDVGAGGMRLFSVLWLLAAVAFVAVTVGLLLGQPWWRPLLLATASVSLLLTLLDVEVAFAGAIINVLLIARVLLAPRLSAWVPALGA